MGKLAIVVLLLTGIAAADKLPAKPSVIGKWRVVGCETSPKDPDNCAHGTIVFEAKKWSVDLPCCKRAKTYVVVSATKDRIKIDSEGEVSEIRIDAKGDASWNPGIGGRVGALSFVREK